jgi:soluble lytic murein transglycosylase-like protein
MKIHKIMTLKSLTILCLLIIASFLIFTSTKLLGTEENTHNENQIYKYVEVENPIPLEMYENLEKYSNEYDIPKHVFYNIAYLETRYRGPFDWDYNPYLVSSAGALGPMQIMPSTADLICKENTSNKKLKTDIELNISISAKLLRKLYDKYGDWEIVCGCYNTGKPIINEYAHFCATNKNYQKNWVNP